MNEHRVDSAETQQIDGKLYQRLRRDVCLLYHELADYGYLMGDLDYASQFDLEYWNLINRIDTGCHEDRFVKNGLLILMLGMIWDELDGSGSSISPHLPEVKRELEVFVPDDQDASRLLDAVRHGVQLLQEHQPMDDRIQTESDWAYAAFVRNYFASNAKMPRMDTGSHSIDA